MSILINKRTRVIVPGLEGPWTPEGGDYTPGVRARAVVR